MFRNDVRYDFFFLKTLTIPHIQKKNDNARHCHRRGKTERKSQALFVLGMKALSNFNYDLCNIVFKELVDSDGDFKMGYFGLAMWTVPK